MRSKSHATSVPAKRAGNVLGHFNLLDGRPAREQRGIDARQNFIQGQVDLTVVIQTIGAIDKCARGELTEFAKGNFDRTEGKLVDRGFHLQENHFLRRGRFNQFRLQIHRQRIDDGRERNSDLLGIL